MKVTRFKDYNGNTIPFPEHYHQTSDTVDASGQNTAMASESVDGFMASEDKIKLDSLITRATVAEEKLKQAVFMQHIKE